ncbi:MAG: trehalose-phosphatase [Terriglobales bacterium]
MQSTVESFLRTVADAPRSLLLLDYDGTLAPFRRERDQAFPYPGVVSVLQKIIHNSRTRVVIISGRDAEDTIRLLGIQPPPEVWGLHGSQRLKPGGPAEILDPDPAASEALAAADDWLGYQQLRHLAEFKLGSIAVHWRDLDEWEADQIRGRILLGWIHIAQDTGLNVLEFDGGVEIRAAATDKSGAVYTIMNEMAPDTPVAYLGDDSTDEHAFRAVNDHGLSVLVRAHWRRTAAQLWIKPPEELLDFLEQWLGACQKQDSLGNQGAAAGVNR